MLCAPCELEQKYLQTILRSEVLATVCPGRAKAPAYRWLTRTTVAAEGPGREVGAAEAAGVELAQHRHRRWHSIGCRPSVFVPVDSSTLTR